MIVSCGYRKKYEDAMTENKKNSIYEHLYEEQKSITYQLQDSLDQYKEEIDILLYKNANQKSTGAESVEVSSADSILTEKLNRLQRKNKQLLKTIAKLDSVILTNEYSEDDNRSSRQNYSYLSKKVHLINTFRSIEAEYPDKCQLKIINEEMNFTINRDLIFSSTYNMSEVGIEIVRQITQAMNPLFGHEMAVASQFSITDPYSDQWKEAIQGQILIAQLMKRFGANQDRLEGANQFIQGDEIDGAYHFLVKERQIVKP